jgi:hypothetical protein
MVRLVLVSLGMPTDAPRVARARNPTDTCTRHDPRRYGADADVSVCHRDMPITRDARKAGLPLCRRPEDNLGPVRSFPRRTQASPIRTTRPPT